MNLLVLALPATAAAASTSARHHERPESRAAARLVRPALAAPGTGYGDAHGSSLVQVIQRRLAQAGFSPGPIDGRYGPLTRRAVVGFQASHGLSVDGVVGPRTWGALIPAHLTLVRGAGDQPGGLELVRVLQRRLLRAGYALGPIDGRYGAFTERAVKRFQARHDLRVDGAVGPRTLALMIARKPHRHPLPHRRSRSRDASSAKASKQPAPRRVPSVSRHIRPTGQSGRSIPGWLPILFAAALAAALTATWLVRRRRADRGPGVVPEAQDHPVNGAAVLPSQNGESHTTGDAPEPARGDGGDAFNLGILLESQGNLAGAQAAYRRAEQYGHGAAACNLGMLLEQGGDPAGAEAAYRRADARGEATGAFNLGVLLQERGALTEAEAAYRRAEKHGNQEVADIARTALRELERDEDERSTGRALAGWHDA